MVATNAAECRCWTRAMTGAAVRRRGRERSALVQGRGHLPAARQGVLRLQRRRHRRLRGPDAEARLHPGARRQHDLAAAVLPVAAARRRLRHRRLPRRASATTARCDDFREFVARGAPARPARSSPSWSSTTPRTSTRGSRRARRAPPGSPKRDFYVWSDTDKKFAGTRIIFTDTETSNWAWDPVAEPVLLAPLLLAPARPQLRQSRTSSKRSSRSCASGSTWASTACGSTRFPTCSSARARTTRTCPRRTRCSSSMRAAIDAQYNEPHAARRGEPVAGGRARVLRRRRRMPHGVSLPADAAHVHGDRAGGPPPDRRDHAADAGHPRELPVGDLPAQPRRADARDGDRPRARLHVPDVRARSAHARQRRHPPAARAAAGATTSTASS